MASSASIEWNLIRGSLPPSTEAGPSRTRDLAHSVLEAEFKAVLLSTEAKSVLSPPSSSVIYTGLPFTPSSSLPDDLAAVDDPLTRLTVAIALLHSFVQLNWTGPDLPFSPLDILPSSSLAESSTTLDDLNAAALPLLTLGGEPAYHLAQQPILFLLASRLFLSLRPLSSSLPTVSLWLLRLHLVHLSLLDEPVSIDNEVLDDVLALVNDPVVEADQDLCATIHLEIGLYYHALGQEKHANQEFLAAAKSSGLEFELTGALGKKTKYQVASISQLVLLAESRRRDGDEAVTAQSADISSTENNTALPETLALNDDTLLEETEFTKVTSTPLAGSSSRLANLDPASQPALHPLDQSLLLSLCLAQHNNSPSSGLTASQMMPFLSRVISHPRNWSIHTTGLLLRSRLEASRSRTVQRSTLQLSALIEQMPTSDSSPKERLRYFHQLPLPSKWEMERELAKRYLSLGVVRSALEIFTRLEMWEDAVQCLQRMDREEEAEQIVRDLLEGKKVESDTLTKLNKTGLTEPKRAKLTSAREAKLFCLLADLGLQAESATRDPAAAKQAAIELYTKAWDLSEHTSSRAMRSIGSLRFSEQNYEAAIPCFQAALTINPLYGRVWFSLGVSFVRLERWTEARDAFRREVGVEEDDGEGWNNLAAVYLRLGEAGNDKDQTGSSVSYENKILAFRALRQGLRYAYGNWRMWQNYMIVAIDVGELSEAARAMTRVVEELASRDPVLAIDPDVLDKLVDSVTRDDYSLGTKDGEKVVPTTSNEGFGLLPIVERLFDVTILPRISDSPRVWRAHGRLLRWKEDWSGAMEDYLRAYRCSIANDEKVERDLEIWREAVGEIEDLVAQLSVLGPKAKVQSEKEEGKRKGDWKFQARGLVRTFMGRTKTSFEGEKEWERLQDLLDELKRAE